MEFRIRTSSRKIAYFTRTMSRSLRVIVVGAFTSMNSSSFLPSAFTSVFRCCRFWKLSPVRFHCRLWKLSLAYFTETMGRLLRVIVVGAFTSMNSLSSLKAFIGVVFGAFNVVVLEAFTTFTGVISSLRRRHRFWSLQYRSLKLCVGVSLSSA
ncbi:6167_t:CDS:2, partial [Dentiscutata erythropus]